MARIYMEIADGDRLEALAHIMQRTPHDDRKPFQDITNRELSEVDKNFLLSIMRLDPRQRPTAKELLAHDCFDDSADNGESK